MWVVGEAAVITARNDRSHGERGGERAPLDGRFRDCDPPACERGPVPLAVTHDADVAGGDRREDVRLDLEGLPAALAGEDGGPGDGVQRDLDVEVYAADVQKCAGEVYATNAPDSAEVVADPLAI